MRLIFAFLAAALFLTTAATAGAPLRITFRNASVATVTDLYVAIASSEDWGAPRLGAKGLAPGGRTQFLLADGADKCVVQIRFHTSAGVVYDKVISLCHNHVFTYNGR